MYEAVKMELEGIYGQQILKEFNEIISYYNLYEGKTEWQSYTTDYEATQKRSLVIKKLIKEQARFFISKTPIFKIEMENKNLEDEIQKFLDKTLTDNSISDKLIKGARDCFIGKRIAIRLHINPIDKSIKIKFFPSLSFVFETNDDEITDLKKIIFFYKVEDNENKNKQVLWKQKFELINNKCYLTEGFYDGNGELIESIYQNHYTGLDFIPAYVILNDGLIDDLSGESDVKILIDNSTTYDRVSSEEIDSLLKNMNRIIYAKNIDGDCIKHFSLKPGSFWDVKKDIVSENEAEIGVIDGDTNYGEKIEDTLKRITNEMHESLNIPLINNQDLKGMMTSGKSMKALYWQLITRCEEKWVTWKPALIWLAKKILKIAILQKKINANLDDIKIEIINQYPLSEDAEEKKQLDLSLVTNQVMSRKSFIKKWLDKTDEEAEEELKQIQIERQILEDSFSQFETQEGEEY